MKIGDLVRYKHNKYQMGIILKFDNSRATYVMDYETGKKEINCNDNILVAWQGKNRSSFVEAQYIEVKGEGRYGWKDAFYENW